MPLYLALHVLQGAVGRLGISATSSSLGDYLIFKRALEIRKQSETTVGNTGPVSVVTGTRSDHFVKAVEELTFSICPGESGIELTNPYFVPFGAMRDKTRGYRTPKFPSNGSSDTVSRWQSRSTVPPLTLLPNTSPKEYTFAERSSSELAEFFLVRNAQENFSGERPRLLDTAIWWYRFRDLAEIFQAEPSATELQQGVIQDLGLTQIELDGVFLLEDRMPADHATDDLPTVSGKLT